MLRVAWAGLRRWERVFVVVAAVVFIFGIYDGFTSDTRAGFYLSIVMAIGISTILRDGRKRFRAQVGSESSN